MARRLASLVLVAALVVGPAVYGQAPDRNDGTVSGPEPEQNRAPGTASPFILEPDAQIQGDRIKQETYRSQPAGQNQNWNLDIGRFQQKIDEDPTVVAPELRENYSGMRLRLPLRGGLGN